jgi:hypothetical protein
MSPPPTALTSLNQSTLTRNIITEAKLPHSTSSALEQPVFLRIHPKSSSLPRLRRESLGDAFALRRNLRGRYAAYDVCSRPIYGDCRQLIVDEGETALWRCHSEKSREMVRPDKD